MKSNSKSQLEMNKTMEYNIAYALPQVVFETNQQGQLVFVNRNAFEVSGYTEDDFVKGQNILYLVPPAERERAREAMGRCLNGQRVQNVQFTVVRKDGTTFPALINATPIIDPDGYPGMVGVVTDITDYQKVQEKLLDSETQLHKKVQYLNTLMENMNEAFITYDLDGRLTFVNKKAVEYSGYPADEMLGQSLFTFIHPEYQEMVAEKVKERLQLRKSDSYETTLLTRQGDKLFIKLNSSPILENGQIQGGMIVAEDISERRQTEEQLRYLTLHDALTGLYNRTFFEEEMRRLSCGRHQPVGLIICDVNGLKLVNDTRGHDQGDELLKAAAQVLKQSFRDNDTVARIGGDEFAILLPISPMPILESAVIRIKNSIDQYNSGHPELPLSISVGLAESSGSPPDMVNLFKEADNQMYRQKLTNSKIARSSLVNSLMNEVLDKLNKD